MLLDEIGGYLALQGLASTSGAGGFQLVKNWLPDSTALQDQVVALVRTGGAAPTPPRLELDRPGLQVLVRGSPVTAGGGAFATANAKMDAIFNALHGLGPAVLPSTSSGGGRYYVMVLANHMPALREVDPQSRPVLVCNFTATRSRT